MHKKYFLRLKPLAELLLFFIRYVVVTTGAKQISFTHALFKMPNRTFCVISFHSCLFVLAFVSFFLDSKEIYIFFRFVISCPPIQ